MNAVLQLVTKLGPSRLAAMGAVTLALVGFFAFLILRVTQPAMGVLFSDLSMQDASAVLRELDARGVRYEARGDAGQTVLVPRADLARVRLELAGKGLPASGSVGYEIFDKGDAFSSTNFVQNVNHLRALEGELARTVRAIGRVQAARVHLVIPERRLFERDREQPSASIALRLAGELEPGQVRAIRHLVASAVAGLRPERISIIDERGQLLADGARSDAAEGGAGLEERQTGLERRLRAQVQEIVAGVVGAGRARVQVAAEFETNRIENRQESFDPESRVVRSTQTRTENQTTGGGGEGVSVGNELPGAKDGQGNAQTKENSNKNEETTNYEISRTTRTEVVEAGRLKRLSVAVVVDGTYARGKDGEAVYQPRAPEELERMAVLVRTAIGFDKGRGDQVEVANLRFAEAPVRPEFKEEGLVAQFLQPTKEDVLRLLELAVLAVLTLLVLLLVVRPLLRRVLAGEEAPRPAALLAREGAGEPAAAGGEPAPLAVAVRESPAARFMEIAKLNGQVQAQTIERVVHMARENPSETVAVLRNWINE